MLNCIYALQKYYNLLNEFIMKENNKVKTTLLENRFSHTLENCLFAKQELIKSGFTEEDFYYANEDDVEVGFLIGEPIKITNDDDCLSALEMYKNKCYSEEVNEDEMYDYFHGNN